MRYAFIIVPALILLSACEVSVNSKKEEPEKVKPSFSLSPAYTDHVNELRDELKYEEALSYIDSLIKDNPDDLVLLKDRGSVKSDLGDYVGAERDYLAVLKKDSSFSEIFIGLGYLEMLKGNLEIAEDYTKQGLKINPSSSMGHMNLGVFNMRKQGDIIVSYTHFRKAIKLDPKNSMAYNNIGYIHMINEGIDSAYYYYDRALEINPNNVTARNNRAGLNSSQDKYQEVLDDLLFVNKLTPTDYSVHSSICFAYYSLGDHKEAIKWGKEAVTLTPESLQAAINYGYALMANGQTDEACEQFNRFEFTPGEELKRIMEPCKGI